MAISDLYGTGAHLRNMGHFAALVSLASVDGAINQHEKMLLNKLADKLDISEEEYQKILEKPSDYPIHPNNTYVGRLERIHDLFSIIYSDRKVDRDEIALLRKYAIAVGFSSDVAEKIIKRSIQIFNGTLDFDDYHYLIERS